MSNHLDVKKTFKLLIGGQLVRSESGRSYEANAPSGQFIANLSLGSRKDVRDAVSQAIAGQKKWWDSIAYNRGQVLYRLAEMAGSRSDELITSVMQAEGISKGKATAEVSRSIDRLVYYAGWTDKVSQVLGTANPVAGPFFNFSVPQPCGVVGVVGFSTLEEFVDAAGVLLASGNSVVALVEGSSALPILTLGEMTLSADFPAGILNIISGARGELAPVLCAHEDVDGIYLKDAGEESSELAILAAQSIKRVRYHDSKDSVIGIFSSFTNVTTVWHSVGQ